VSHHGHLSLLKFVIILPRQLLKHLLVPKILRLSRIDELLKLVI
jgi:hypothetical protein